MDLETPPVHMNVSLPPSLVYRDGQVRATVSIPRGTQILSYAALGVQRPVSSAEPTVGCRYDELLVGTDDGSIAKLTMTVTGSLLQEHAIASPSANCVIDERGLTAVQSLQVGEPLLPAVSEVTVLTQDMPRLLRVASNIITNGFLYDSNVPSDFLGVAGREATVDGYVTILSMARIAAHALHCAACAVIGCGYGDVLALLAIARRPSAMVGFEVIAERMAYADRMVHAVGASGLTRLYGDFSTFSEQWPEDPTLIWCARP